MFIRMHIAELSSLTAFASYQYVAVIGEKVSCIFLINHYLPPQQQYCIKLQYIYSHPLLIANF
ncbi:hypothetical protein F0333_03200 [Klebsiella aerogenes]|nr:hypothetical protein F0333_03200 [Klebsiella aerogenes]